MNGLSPSSHSSLWEENERSTTIFSSVEAVTSEIMSESQFLYHLWMFTDVLREVGAMCALISVVPRAALIKSAQSVMFYQHSCTE